MKTKKISKKVKANTVNVIEVINGIVNSVRAFVNTGPGYKKARQLFKELVIEHENDSPESAENTEHKVPDEEEIDYMLDRQGYDDGNGYNVVFIYSE